MTTEKLNNEVSVITPCFNSIEYIQSAIESVANQTVKVLEHIVVDDGSEDDTVKLLHQLKSSFPNLKILSQTNQGAGIARNAGINVAKGRYIAFLDSDDLWYRSKLEKQLEQFQVDEPALVFSSYNVFDEQSKKIVRTVNAAKQVKYNDLLKTNPIGCLTAIYDTRRVGKVFMPELRQRQDWGLWMRILEKHDLAIGVREPLAELRVRGGSLTANKIRATWYSWRLLREEAKLGTIKAGLSVLSNLFHAAKRRM